MDWQWVVVLACVLVAAAYVARRAWRTWHPKPGSCGGGCGSGCAAPAEEPRVTMIPADQLTLRKRVR
ncbi:MAG TPA: FeoB-associated Cys-rich membrane protein [Gemmataceae bacterium]